MFTFTCSRLFSSTYLSLPSVIDLKKGNEIQYDNELEHALGNLHKISAMVVGHALKWSDYISVDTRIGK